MAEKQDTATIIAMVAEGFFSRLSFGLVSFALPLYAYQMGMSLVEIGFLTSISLIVSILLKPVIGSLADRFGFKRTLAAAIGVRGVVAFLLVFAIAPWHLYLIRAIHGSSKSMRDPAANALIAESGGKKRIASSFAWYQTAKSMAGSGGKAFAGVLLTLTASNFAVVFGVAFLLSMLPLIAVMRFVRPDRSDAHIFPATDAVSSSQWGAAPDPRSKDDSQPGLLPFVMLGGLINGTAYMLGGLFPILAIEYAGLSEAQTGIIYMASSGIILFSGPLFGWLADNVSHKLVLSLRSAANIASSIIYLIAPTLVGVFIGRAVDDLGKSAYRPAWGALMSQVSDFEPRHRARTMSWMSVGEDIGEILGPIFAGFLWSAFGIAVLLVGRALVAAGVEVYAVWVSRRLHQREAFSHSQPIVGVDAKQS
ncbi:MAG: MFS transporter [Caldilinea sp.]